MTTRETALLVRRMRDFVEGRDRSLPFVRQLEGLVIESFSEADFYDDLVTSLAMYRPGGGEYLYDEDELAENLRRVLTTHFPDASGSTV